MSRSRLLFVVTCAIVALVCCCSAVSGLETVTLTPLVAPFASFIAARPLEVTFTATAATAAGGANLTLTCTDATTTVSPASQCLSAVAGTFLVTAGAGTEGTTVVCSAAITGLEAATYGTVDSISATVVAANVFAVNYNSASLTTSATAPLTVSTKGSIIITITPPSAIDADVFTNNLVVRAVCTNLAQVVSNDLLFTADDADNLELELALSVGNSLCVFSFLDGDLESLTVNQLATFALLNPLYLTAVPATELVVLGMTQTSQGSTTSATLINGTFKNPFTSVSPADSQLTVGMQCTTTDPAGDSAFVIEFSTPDASDLVRDQAADSESASTYTFSTPLSAATNGQFIIHVPAIPTQGVFITCTFTTLAGTSAPLFDYPQGQTYFRFFVGARLASPVAIAAGQSTQLIAGAAATPSIGQIQFNLSMTQTASDQMAGTGLTLDVSCTQGSLNVFSGQATLAVGETFNSTTASAPSASGNMVCLFQYYGDDALRWQPTSNRTFAVVSPRVLNITSVPVTGTTQTAGSTSAVSSFVISVANPLIPAAWAGQVSVGLTCTGVVASTSGVIAATTGTSATGAVLTGSTAVSGTTVTSNLLTFSTPTSAATTQSNTFTLKVPIIPVGTGVTVNCNWVLSDSMVAAFVQPDPISFFVGTRIQLTTASADSTNSAPIDIVYLEQQLWYIEATSGTIDTDLTVSVDCTQLCGSGVVMASSAPTLNGSFPQSRLENYIEFTGITPGQVTCRFSLSGTDAAHFLPPTDLVFNVIALRDLVITANHGVDPTLVDTPSLIATTAAVAVTFTIAAPSAALTLQVECTSDSLDSLGGSIGSLVLAGGTSVVDDTISGTASSTTSATVQVLITPPTNGGSIPVWCSFNLYDGATYMFNDPNSPAILVGPAEQLSATYTSDSYYPGDAPTVTVSTALDVPTLGFSLTVTCTLSNSTNDGDVTVNGDVNSCTLTIDQSTTSTVISTFTAGTNFGKSGVITCVYALSGTDAVRFVAPSATTITILSPVSWSISGAAVAATGADPIILSSDTATTMIVVAPSAALPVGATVTMSCADQQGNALVSVTTKTFVAADAATSTKGTFVVTLPATGTAASFASNVITCTCSASPDTTVVESFTARQFVFAIGTPLRYTIVKPTTPIYTSVDIIQTAYSTGVISHPTFAGFALTSTGTCAGTAQVRIRADCTGGWVTFTNSGSNEVLATSTDGLESIPFSYSPPTSGTLVGPFTCRFTTADQNGAYTAPIPDLTVSVSARQSISVTEISSKLGLNDVVNGTISLPGPAPAGGVTALISCDRSFIQVVPSRVYFFEGTYSPVTLTFTTQTGGVDNFPGWGVCTIYADGDVDSSLSTVNQFKYAPTQITGGVRRTVTLTSAVMDSSSCSGSTTVTVTLSAAPVNSALFVFTCAYGMIPSATFGPSDSLTRVVTYTNTHGQNMIDSCTVAVPQDSTYNGFAYDTSAAVAKITIGTQSSSSSSSGGASKSSSSTGRASSSSTGTACLTCGALTIASLPSLALYATMLITAIIAARN